MLLPSFALRTRHPPSAKHYPHPFRLLLLLLTLGSLSAFHSLAVVAQETVDDDVVRVSTDLTVFPIRVRDKKGNPVAGLTPDDFQLRDVDRISSSFYLANGADRVALTFMLDQSGSLRDIISLQRDAALSLFDRFGPTSRVSVIRFMDQAKIVVPLGLDKDAARRAFDFPASRNSRTAIFDAAVDAVQQFAKGNRDITERRIVILVSDGLDNSSRVAPDSVIAAARAANISFYTIQIPLFEPRDGRLQVRRASKGFRELAEKTGGAYFLVGNAKNALLPDQHPDLGPIFTAIEDDLRSQYVVGFYANERAHDGKEHRVSITLMKQGLSYSVAQFGYERTHNFSVTLKPRTSMESK
jgi:Ca-activated chloride channel homolog